MSENKLKEVYPLSKENKIKGTRRLVREKVLQTYIAHITCETELPELFEHIFFREFNFEAGDKEIEDQIEEKFLRPEEIYELEADVPITWNAEAVNFGYKLLERSLVNKESISELIEKFAKNWELDRIAPVDKALITIAATEFLDFNDIPPKVTINEALDIAKQYSTDKSRVFINGVLDSMLGEFKSEGKIKKTGRGLA